MDVYRYGRGIALFTHSIVYKKVVSPCGSATRITFGTNVVIFHPSLPFCGICLKWYASGGLNMDSYIY